MRRAPRRPPRAPLLFAGPATLAFLAARALGAPVATTAQRPASAVALPGTAAIAPGPPISPAAAERLRKAGLDAKDPAFASKLKSLAASAGASYVRAHVLSSTAAPSRAAGRAHRSLAGGAGASSAAGTRALALGLPVPGNIVSGWDDTPSLLGGNPPLSATHGKTWPGRYFFLVRTNKKIAVKGGPGFSWGSTSLSYGCNAKLGMVLTDAAAADDPNWTYGLQKLSPANGSYPYYVSVEFTSLPIGRPRNAQMTISFENVVTAPYSVVLQPDVGTATISVTVDHAPQLTGGGVVYPWGATNFSAANAKLGAPSTARVGGGNWQTQTAGDDLVGVGVGLGPGWKVVSAAVKSAMSALSPQDTSPDNTWRGAAVTTPPSGSDLRTAVHWHYSGIDSLDYTIEWTLEGPMGQRPLLTLAKYGDCDQ